MPQIQILNNLYGKTVTDLKAYGIDTFDFTPNLLGTDFSVGQFGYAVFVFGDDQFYISIDGISSNIPPRKNMKELIVPENIKDTFLGTVLQSITFDGEQYFIKFEGLELLRGHYEPNNGHTDRAYFDLVFPWV